MSRRHLLKKMAVDKYTLTLEKSFSRDSKNRAKKLGYKSIQQLVYDLLHHDVYGKKHPGGKPKKSPIPEEYKRFAIPTKETYKIIRENGGKM